MELYCIVRSQNFQYKIEANIKDREYIIKAPKEKWPEIIGHKRCNKEYFKEKYNVSIKLEESLKVIN